MSGLRRFDHISYGAATPSQGATKSIVAFAGQTGHGRLFYAKKIKKIKKTGSVALLRQAHA
jgi:hypothetical protein